MRKESQQRGRERPILFVDVDGVISLFGFDPKSAPPGLFHSIDGILHCISHAASGRLARLARSFELVWATGWEEKANEYLPRLLQMSSLPSLSFDGRARFGSAHWKLDAIDEYAGDRPAAWIDDSIDEQCERWAADRAAPTVVVRPNPSVGIEEVHVERLLRFAESIDRGTDADARGHDGG